MMYRAQYSGKDVKRVCDRLSRKQHSPSNQGAYGPRVFVKFDARSIRLPNNRLQRYAGWAIGGPARLHLGMGGAAAKTFFVLTDVAALRVAFSDMHRRGIVKVIEPEHAFLGIGAADGIHYPPTHAARDK